MRRAALPRIKTKRPLQFLSPAGAAIADGLRDFVSVGAFSAPSAASNSTSAPLQGDPLAKEAFRGVLLFVRSVCSWVVVSLDKEREVTELGSVRRSLPARSTCAGLNPPRAQALALFEALLHQAVVLLHLFAPANLASTYFYRRFPTYRPRGPPPEPTDGELAWELFDVRPLSFALRVRFAELLRRASSTSSVSNPPSCSKWPPRAVTLRNRSASARSSCSRTWSHHREVSRPLLLGARQSRSSQTRSTWSGAGSRTRWTSSQRTRRSSGCGGASNSSSSSRSRCPRTCSLTS